MAFPPGVRSLSQIQTEFGGDAPTDINEYYRGGRYVVNSVINYPIPAAVDNYDIALGNFQGGALITNFAPTITSNTFNYNVATQALADPFYVAGSTNVVVTINAGVYIGSNSPSLPALLVPADGPGALSPGDTVTIVNNGVIQARGGNGGDNSAVGAEGGTAVQTFRPITIENNGFLIGGGGGGGGGATFFPFKGGATQGGAGGGGAGYNGGAGGSSLSGTGGTGTISAGGAGVGYSGYAFGGTGGAPGAAGAAGGNTSGGGGGATGGAGGAAGFYLKGFAFTTFTATGTRIGNVS